MKAVVKFIKLMKDFQRQIKLDFFDSLRRLFCAIGFDCAQLYDKIKELKKTMRTRIQATDPILFTFWQKLSFVN